MLDVPSASSPVGSAIDPERRWVAEVYQPDARQLTVRAALAGCVLGGVMALSNLYVVLKTGWSLGVTITACILAFAFFRGARAARLARTGARGAGGASGRLRAHRRREPHGNRRRDRARARGRRMSERDVMRPSAVVCGHVTLDRVAGGLVPGGSAWYAAHTFRTLGADTRVLTAAGPDYPPDALAGVTARIAPAARTTLFVNVHAPAGRRTQRVEASAPPLDAAALGADWRGADVLYLAPVLGEIAPRAFVTAAGARKVGLGVQGLVRAVAPDGAVVQPRWSFAPDELAGVTAAFVGEDDLRGQGDLVARLADAVPIVVFTRGADGCEVIAGGRRAAWACSPRARSIRPAPETCSRRGSCSRSRAARSQSRRLASERRRRRSSWRGSEGRRSARIGEAFERVSRCR